jgi:uncharacterized ferritin-like protein (DUF455 family)
VLDHEHSPSASVARTLRVLDSVSGALGSLSVAAARAVVEIPVLDGKVACGRCLWFLADGARAVNDRVVNIGGVVGPVAADEGIKLHFASCTVSESASRLTALADGCIRLQARAAEELRGIHPVWDEPTKIALETVIARLEDGHRSLADGVRKLESSAAAVSDARQPGDVPARDSRIGGAASPPVHVQERHGQGSAIPGEMAPALHDFLVKVEISALEVAARMLVVWQHIGWEFVADLARQCWDESRHCVALVGRIEELGGAVGRYPASRGLVWEMTDQASPELCLASMHRIGEWLGADTLLRLADELREPDPVTAAMLAFMAADEVSHSALGNRWIRKLADGDEEEIWRIHEQAERARVALGDKRNDERTNFVHVDSCRRAGFTEKEIERLTTHRPRRLG